MFLCELSPITQRRASTRFDLPQPFGPTTPVSPGSIRRSVGSTKDLKPTSLRRVSFIATLLPGDGRGSDAKHPTGSRAQRQSMHVKIRSRTRLARAKSALSRSGRGGCHAPRSGLMIFSISSIDMFPA